MSAIDAAAGGGTHAEARPPAPPVAEMVVDMPNQTRADDGRHVVPVWVRRSDIQAAYGRRDAAGEPIGDVRYGAALNRFADATHQPVYDAEYRRTGEYLKGPVGFVTLDSTFGAKHRRLWLDVAKMTAIAQASGSGAHSLLDLVDGNSRREDEMRRMRSERSRSGKTVKAPAKRRGGREI